MAISTADGWFAAAKQKILMQRVSLTTVASQQFSLWGIAGNPGAGTRIVGNSTTGVVPTDATAGAPNINAFGSGATGYLAAARFRNTVPGSAVLYDRLVHFGTATNLTPTGTTTYTAPASSTNASVSGTVLTVSGSVTGTFLPGMPITGTGITAGTIILSNGTGSGGTGTYNLSASSAATGTITVSGWPQIASRLPGFPSGTIDFGNIEILLEVTAAVAASAVTVSITYTNQAGVTGRSTGASAALTSFTLDRMIAMPLQAGDTGVQKIEAIVIGGTAAATGSVNVILARRLATFDLRGTVGGLDAQGWDLTGAPVVFADSCLWLTTLIDSTVGGSVSLDLDIING